MSIGISKSDSNVNKTEFCNLTEEEIREYALKALEHGTNKIASFFNSLNLTDEKIDLIASLREINHMLTEENRTLDLAIHNFFKNSETIRNEAIKEFAKLLIEKSENGVINVSDIPDFVAEMVGETDDQCRY